MNKRIRMFAAVLTMLLFCGLTVAQEPVEDINPKNHPNLAAAQKNIVQANRYINMAQKDNTYDMKDHAEKARQLLAQANQELKAAAETANAANAAKKAKH